MLCLTGNPAGAAEIQMQGDRLSLKASREPLRLVLKEFIRAGVRVKLDPRIAATVTGQFKDEDIQQALGVLFEPFGYVLIWDVIPGPLGQIPKLAEIQIFKPGDKGNMEPLIEESGNLIVATGPDGKTLFVKDEILIGIKPGTSVEEFKTLLSQLGATLVDSIPELGIYRIRLTAGSNILALVEQLKKNPIVAAVEPNYVFKMPAPLVPGTPLPATAQLTGVAATKGTAPVAILDSGLQPYTQMDALIAGRYDALNPDRTLTDSLGHGTQMALLACGLIQPEGTGSELDQTGLPVVAIKAFDDNGYASSYSLMQSINYAIGQDARAINMSWGSEVNSEFLADSIAYAQDKGLVVVASAGNEPTGKAVYPAAYPGVVGVSAVSPSGTLWDQSNYGDFVTAAAPGYATFPVGYNGPAGAYAGTSISAVIVTRAFGLYFAENPKATTTEAVTAFKSSLTDTGTKGKDAKYGYGTLDTAAMKRFLSK